MDDQIARLDAKLVAAFDKVKRDNDAIYQWLNFFYDEASKQKAVNSHQQEAIGELKSRLKEMPQPLSRTEIKEMVDSFYDHETLMERVQHISDKLDKIEESRQKAPARHMIQQAPAIRPVSAFREKMVKKNARNSKDYIKSMVISMIRKYGRISAMALREMIVDEQVLCSKSSFYRLLEEIEQEEGITSISSGREKVYVAELSKHARK